MHHNYTYYTLSSLTHVLYLQDTQPTEEVLDEDGGGETSQSTTPATNQALSSTKPKGAKRRAHELTTAVKELHDISVQLNKPEPDWNEHDAFGVYVASSLKRLPIDVALLAHSDIQGILTRYRLQHLSPSQCPTSCNIVSDSSLPPPPLSVPTTVQMVAPHNSLSYTMTTGNSLSPSDTITQACSSTFQQLGMQTSSAACNTVPLSDVITQALQNSQNYN